MIVSALRIDILKTANHGETMLKNKNTRREFIKVLSVAPVGALFLNLGCSGVSSTDVGVGVVIDTGPDMKDSLGASKDIGSETNLEVSKQDTADATKSDADLNEDVELEVCDPSGSDVEGPFHEDGAPERTKLVSAGEPGMPLIVFGRVLDEQCNPLKGASLDVWHADDNGEYHDTSQNFRCRGQMKADGTGAYMFTSVKPGRYPLGDSLRPAHVHFIVSQPGFIPLTTQMYFGGDPFLGANDPCGNGCNAGDETLIVPFTTDGDGTVRALFDIVLRRA